MFYAHDLPARHPRSLWANRDCSGRELIIIIMVLLLLLLLNFPALVAVMVNISSSSRNYTAAASAALLRCRYRHLRSFLPITNSRRSSVYRASDACETSHRVFSRRETSRPAGVGLNHERTKSERCYNKYALEMFVVIQFQQREQNLASCGRGGSAPAGRLLAAKAEPKNERLAVGASDRSQVRGLVPYRSRAKHEDTHTRGRNRHRERRR